MPADTAGQNSGQEISGPVYRPVNFGLQARSGSRTGRPVDYALFWPVSAQLQACILARIRACFTGPFNRPAFTGLFYRPVGQNYWPALTGQYNRPAKIALQACFHFSTGRPVDDANENGPVERNFIRYRNISGLFNRPAGTKVKVSQSQITSRPDRPVSHD